MICPRVNAVVRHLGRRRRLIRGAALAAFFLLLTAAMLGFETPIRKRRERVSEKKFHFLQPLATWRQEMERLQEFLDRKRVLCKVARSVANVPVCIEDRGGRKLNVDNMTIVTVEPDDYAFTREVYNVGNNVRMTVLTSNSQLKALNGSRLQDRQLSAQKTTKMGKELLDDLRKVLKDLNVVNILTFRNLGDVAIDPLLVEQLADESLLDSAVQFHVFMTLNKDSKLLFRWYSVLVNLKLNHDLFVYNVRHLNGCSFLTSDNIQTCIYIVSLMRKTDDQLIMVPELKGSSYDQANDVLSLITKKQHQCAELTLHSLPSSGGKIATGGVFLRPINWPLCLKHLSTPPCTILSLRHSKEDPFSKFLGNLGCKVCSNTENDQNSLSCTDSIETTLDHFLQRMVTTITLLYLNLHGGEWSILQRMIDNNLLKYVNQIVATVHVWYGEDYHRLLRHQMILKEMANLGFEVYFSQPLMDISNPHESLKNSFTKYCCFVVGWLKNPMKLS